MGFPKNILRFQIFHLGELAGGLWGALTEHVATAPQGLSRTSRQWFGYSRTPILLGLSVCHALSL